MRLIKLLIIALLLMANLEAKQKVNVKFSNLQINDFIKLISKITNKNILITHKINGTVDLVSTAPIYDTEVLGILVSVLESKGYTLIQKGSILEVVRSVDASKYNAKVLTRGKRARGTLMVTQIIKVKGENVDIVAAKIRYLISKTAKLMTMKESNLMIVTDYPANIETIKRVIKDIDTNNKAIVETIHISNAEVKKIQLKLQAISKTLFNEKVAGQKVNIILDENTNSVVLVGVQENVDKLKLLIKTLDVESAASNGIKIYSLKNSDAKSVLASLNDIISKQTFADPSMKPNVSASEEINAIIAIGVPQVLKGVKMVIDELDKEKYQVYVQARIIEINKKNSKAIGVKYGFDGGGLSNGGLYTLAGSFGGTLPSSALFKASGANFALGAALEFLEQKGASKSISNPSILCVNNKESSIYVGKTISISTGSVTSSTSSIPGVTKSYKRKDVGLTLSIKPRVSSNDKVTLDIETTLENLLDDGSNNISGQPVTSKQKVKTQAILRHAESIIIGGLVKTYDLESVTKVPFLGDIWWIGDWLFSSKSVSAEEDSLVVILTPYVIEKSEKLSKLQQDLGKLSRLQQQYNKEVFKRIETNGQVNTLFKKEDEKLNNMGIERQDTQQDGFLDEESEEE